MQSKNHAMLECDRNGAPRRKSNEPWLRKRNHGLLIKSRRAKPALTAEAPTEPASINENTEDEKHAMHPTPDQIRITRKQAGFSQTIAAELIHSNLRTWQDWEAGKAKMHPGLWELFQIKTGAK